MRLFSKRWVCAAATLLALCATGQAAGPLDDQVPQDALMYVGWAGSDALQGQYAGSNLKGVVDASAARDFIKQQLPRLIDLAARNDPAAPQVIAKLQTGLDVAWRHPSAFYFCPVGMTDPRAPEFRFGLLCDAGGDAKTLTDLLNEALTKAPPPPELPMKVAQDGTLVSMTFGKASTLVERRKGGGLAAAPAYIKAMAGLKPARPALAMYIDVAAGMGNLKDALNKIPDMPPDARTKATTVIDILGVEGLTQIASVSGFDGKEWSDQSFAGISGAPKGIVALMGVTPLSDGVLNAVPKEALSFTTVKIDLHQVFMDVRTAIGKIDAPTLTEFDAALAQGNQRLGLDIEQDLVAPLGDESVIYRAPLGDAGGYSYALVQKLRDGDRLSRALVKCEALINEAAGGQFKIEKMTSGQIQYSSVAMLQYSIAWTVRNGYLYVSTMEGLPGAVKQVENKLPNVTENDLYRKALAALPAGVKPTALSFSTPAKLYPELRRTLVGLLPLARAAGVNLPTGLLPDPDSVAEFMTPGARVSWYDASGVHQAGRSAFPGAELIGGNPGGSTVVMGVAVGAAVALPALARARTQATVAVDATNLKGISIACLMYSNDKGKMPDDFAQLVAAGTLQPRMLVGARTGTPPLVMTPELEKLAKDDPAKFAEQVAEHCDFVYLGKGSSIATDAASVLAYDKPGPWASNGLNLAFGDGHVEFVNWGGMDSAFQATNESLKKRGVPAVDVQGLLRQAGAAAPVPMRTVPNLP